MIVMSEYLVKEKMRKNYFLNLVTEYNSFIESEHPKAAEAFGGLHTAQEVEDYIKENY